MTLLFASAVLVVKLIPFRGLWLGQLTDTQGRKLRMLVDTGSNITLVTNPESFPNGVCVAVGDLQACSGHPAPIGAYGKQCQALIKAGVDGLMGEDFWRNFRKISIDRDHETLTAEM